MQLLNRLDRKKLLIAAASLLVLTLVYAPNAVALPQYDVFHSYYDECLNQNGWYWIDCFGNVAQAGTLSGAYRDIVRTHCDTGAITVQWYRYEDGAWVPCDPPTQPPGC